MSTIFRRLLHLLRRSRHEADLREEMETHRVLRQAALQRHGLAETEAASASRRALGNLALAREDAREVWVSAAIESIWQDVRFVLRSLRWSPAFSVVAIATLALSIGANTALFAIFNSLVLRPLPVRDPASLAYLTGADYGSWTYPIWEVTERLTEDRFDGALAWANATFDLSSGGATDPLDGAYVSGSFFDVLGVKPVRGRLLARSDDHPGADAATAVISYRAWQRRFGGAHDIVGQRLTLDRVSFTIVGVMPPDFFGAQVGRVADVVIPFAAEPLLRGPDSLLRRRSSWWLEIMIRTAPGQTIEVANVALRSIQPQIRAETLPDEWPATMLDEYLAKPMVLASAPNGNSPLRSRFETPLMAMLWVVGLLLLIACANIANLFLARLLGRRRELSVRLAVGVPRWRLARLLIAESLIVAGAGTALGVMFATWGSGVLVRQLATWRGAVSLNLELDWTVLGFTAALVCLAVIAAGVIPVFGLKDLAPAEALRHAGRTVVGDRKLSLRGVLLVAQIALSIVLVVAAGLFLRTFASASRLPLGFDGESLVVANVNLQMSSVDREQWSGLIDRLLEATATVPGVTSAAVSRITPVTGAAWNGVVGDEHISAAERSQQLTWLNAVTPGWFATMGIPLVMGRDVRTSDRSGAPVVAVVNQTFVRRFLANDRPPVGQIVHVGGGSQRPTPYEVIGVVADAVYRFPREGETPTMFLSFAQQNQLWLGSQASLTMRVEPEQRAAVMRDVTATLVRTEPAVAVTFRTFDELVDAHVTHERLVAMLSASFGGLGLLLTGVGLYGVIAQAVHARQTEIGVRMALGASPAGIVRLVLGHVGVLVATGVLLGTGVSLWAATFVRTMLFQLDPRDPATFASAIAVLVGVAITAAWIPTRRAARVDPATSLREG